MASTTTDDEGIFDAAIQGDLERVQRYLRDGQQSQDSINKALFAAASRGSLDLVVCLVEVGGANPRAARDHWGDSPLRCACQNGCFNVAQYLAARSGMDILTKLDTVGFPPHMSACWSGNFEITLHLIETYGLDVNARYGSSKISPIHVAASKNNTHATIFLWQRHANLEICNDDGRTPLHVCASSGNFETGDLLVRLGVVVDAVDKQGDTPFLKALKAIPGPNMKLVRCLLAAGANLHHVNRCGDNALTCGALYPRVNKIANLDGDNQPHYVCEFLLNYDPTTLSRQGERALIAACQVKRRNIVRLLTQAMAEKNARWALGQADKANHHSNRKSKGKHNSAADAGGDPDNPSLPETWVWPDRVEDSDDLFDSSDSSVTRSDEGGTGSSGDSE